MSLIRRASANPLRGHGIRLASNWTYDWLDPADGIVEEKSGVSKISIVILDKPKRLYYSVRNPCQVFVGIRNLSSHAGASSGGKVGVNSEYGFSDLETSDATDPSGGSSTVEDDELDSGTSDEGDLEEAPENELIIDTEGDTSEVISKRENVHSLLFKVIADERGPFIHSVLDKYLADGNDLSRKEISLAILNLRRRKMFGRALQLSEWLEANKKIDLLERDYASRLDLIAKVRGLQKAEYYVESIPKSFRGEVIYRTLLANCVATGNSKKAEEVFNRMNDLGFPLTAFTCNQMLLLYKKFNKKQIADVLQQMEKENIEPTRFTYGILIDAKGQSNDIAGMDQVVEKMKGQGFEPDIHVQAVLARHYVNAGLEEKAEAVLKEIEGVDLNDKRWACPILLPLYAKLGKEDEVRRVWKVCEAKPREKECLAAIEAWGQLKNIEEAEKVFYKKLETSKKSAARLYSVMLKVYSDHKMVSKGKDLVKLLGESGCQIGPDTWDSLVRLYIEAGEVEKAESLLQKAVQQKQKKPLFSSYMAIMDQYAKRGDVHNAEKIFHRMREAGYVARARPYQALIQAHINAKAPAYGIRERMKADNVYPNRGMGAQLAQVDAFRRTPVSDLLD